MPPRTTLASQAVKLDVDRNTLAQARRNRPNSPTPYDQHEKNPSTPTNRPTLDKEQSQAESLRLLCLLEGCLKHSLLFDRSGADTVEFGF